MLDNRSNFWQIKLIYLIHKKHGMRISHGDTCHLIGSIVAYRQKAFYYRRLLESSRDGRSIQNRHTHIHGYFFNLIFLVHPKPQHLNTSKRFQRDLGLIGQALFVNILSYAPGSITTHLRLRSVGVKHTHFKITILGRQYHNQPIGTDTLMPVAQLPGQLRQIFETVLKTVYINIIVAGPMHFCKSHNDSIIQLIITYISIIVQN
ncbi:hypothetical protein SDC9_95939 [bioreactor metagenome]|uniref:Uncharacterized protein n=1 Tax=bioreactor metagenome TaxID=1076179 RepID=A0A645AA91_9ZZZZ